MLIERFLEDPIAALAYAERRVNVGSPSGFSAPEHQPPAPFNPASDDDAFLVPIVAPQEPLAVLSNDAPAAVQERFVAGGRACLPVHPVALAMLGEAPAVADEWAVQPMAGARTVLTAGAPRLFLKLHYPRLIGRVPRELPYRRVASSIEVDAAVARAVERGLVDENAGLLRERLGMVGTFGDTEIGAIVRETQVFPARVGRFVVPFFALWSPDSRAPGDPCLLHQILRAAGDPAAVAVDVLRLVLASYASLAWSAGLLPECHGQNVLLELDADLRPTRAVYRDLLDWYVDESVNDAAAPDAAFAKKLDAAADAEGAYETRSLLFDFKLSGYLLRPLVDSAGEICSGGAAVLTEAARSLVHACAAEVGVDLGAYFQPYERVAAYPDTADIWGGGRVKTVNHVGPPFR